MALFPPPPRIRNLEISPYWNTSVHSLIFDTWEEVEWRAPCINKIRIHPKNLSVQTHEHPPNYRGGWGESSTDSEAWNNKEQEKTKQTDQKTPKKNRTKKPKTPTHSPAKALAKKQTKTHPTHTKKENLSTTPQKLKNSKQAEKLSSKILALHQRGVGKFMIPTRLTNCSKLYKVLCFVILVLKRKGDGKCYIFQVHLYCCCKCEPG